MALGPRGRSTVGTLDTLQHLAFYFEEMTVFPASLTPLLRQLVESLLHSPPTQKEVQVRRGGRRHIRSVSIDCVDLAWFVYPYQLLAEYVIESHQRTDNRIGRRQFGSAASMMTSYVEP